MRRVGYSLALVVLVLGSPAFAALHGPKALPHVSSDPRPRFIKRVREITSKLSIVPGRWKMIICHHSALQRGNAATYDRDHRRRGMENGLAYHFVIGNGIDSGDGEIEIGSRWFKQIKGGHVRSDEVNEIAIGICLVGNLEEQKPTKNQVAALKELLIYLRDHVTGPEVKFLVHGEADPHHTACPGRYFPTETMRRLFK